jgi:hypothetical protein
VSIIYRSFGINLIVNQAKKGVEERDVAGRMMDVYHTEALARQ